MPSLIATLGANIAPFTRELSAAKGEAQKQGSGIGAAFGNEITSKLAGLASVAGLSAIAKETIEWGSRVQDLSMRLGISTDAIQQWEFALKQTGSSIEAAAPFFEKLAQSRKKALDGNEQAIASFAKFGITLDQLRNTRLEDIGAQIARAFETGDPQQLIADFRALGGKSAGALVAAFREGLTDLFKDAPIAASEVIGSLDELGDTFSRLKSQFTAAVAPALVGIMQAIEALINTAQTVLAIPIGALVGLIDEAKKISLGDMLNPVALGKRLGSAAFEGAGDAVRGLSDLRNKEEDKAAAKRARITKGGAGGPIEEAEENEKVAKKKEKLAEDARKAHMAQMEREAKQEAALAKKNADAKKKEEDDLSKRFQAADPNEVNSLQRIGGFLGTYQAAPQVAMLDLQRKSESHLAAIKELLKGKTGAGNISTGVQF